jgi:hypothetical protein
MSRRLRLRARETVRTAVTIWRVFWLMVFLIIAAFGAVATLAGAGMLADGTVPLGDVALVLGLGLLYLFGGLDELRLFLNWLRGRPPRYRP